MATFPTTPAVARISIEAIVRCICGNDFLVSIPQSGECTQPCAVCGTSTRLDLDGDLIWVAEPIQAGVPEDDRRLNSGMLSIGSVKQGLAAKSFEVLDRLSAVTLFGRKREA